MRRLRELVRDNSVKLILVGLPLRLDGTHGEMAEETERFAQRLRKQIGVPVEMVDERLTSWEAERILEEQFGRKSKQIDGASKKKDADKVHGGLGGRNDHSSRISANADNESLPQEAR